MSLVKKNQQGQPKKTVCFGQATYSKGNQGNNNMIHVEEASPPRANNGNRRTRTNIQPPNSNNRRRDKKRYVHAFLQ